MTDERAPNAPDVTEEFQPLLRLVGTHADIAHFSATDGACVASTSNVGGTPVFGFGPDGETVILPCRPLRPGNLVIGSGRAWGLTDMSSAPRLAMWDTDGRVRDLLNEAGLRSFGGGGFAVAAPWVSWYTAEQPQRVALLNIDSGVSHFVSRSPDTMGFDGGRLHLWTDGADVRLIYCVYVAPGVRRHELFESTSKASTVIDVVTNALMSDARRLVWQTLPGMVPTTLFGPGSKMTDPNHAPLLVCAPWSDLTQRRTLGHPVGEAKVAYGQIAWLEAGGTLKVDDGETVVVATGLHEPFIASVGGSVVGYASGGQFWLWTRRHGVRLLSRRSQVQIALSQSHLFVSAQRRATMRYETAIFGVDLSDLQASPSDRACNAPVITAESLPPRIGVPHRPSRQPTTTDETGVTVSAVAERLRHLMATHFPRATHGRLRPPATETHLQNVETAMGQRLPDDVRELYLRFDGTTLPSAHGPRDVDCAPPLLFPHGHWCSLEDMLRSWQGLQTMPVDAKYNTGNEQDSDPLREYVYHRSWIPISNSGTSDGVYMDLEPSRWGIRGQLFSYDFESGPRMLATSLLAHLDKLLRYVEQGLLEAYQGTWVDPDTREAVYQLD